MNKKKLILDRLIEALEDESEAVNYGADIMGIIDKMLNYYEIYDLDCSTAHYKIFKKLYIEKRHDTYYKLSYDNFIDVRTLERYRKKYNALAEKLIKQDSILSNFS